MLGRLTPLYVFASNFYVTPCLAVVATTPQWDPNPHEVARVLELPLDRLLDPRQRASHVRQHRGRRFATRHIQCGDDQIWGATGMILMEVAQVVQQAREAERPCHTR